MKLKILVDASHVEEKRVAIINEKNKLEEFEWETSTKQHCKSNIYLAKIIRVEPSLQAAFVDFGGNRHGFLAFNEIHPDYYQIPISDKEKLEEELAKEQIKKKSELEDIAFETMENPLEGSEDTAHEASHTQNSGQEEQGFQAMEGTIELQTMDESLEIQTFGGNIAGEETKEDSAETAGKSSSRDLKSLRRFRRYKIQEVIKRNQILLVQVVKEERGNKGAALTTYLSLAGRYSVLMANTPHAGGISRKISNPTDRKRLREVLGEVPTEEKQSLIIRTAGQGRTKLEIKRDFEYLVRTWDKIRERTLNSLAPSLIYEEGDIIRSVIRDLYSKDVEEILIEGEEDYKTAKAFMKTLVPSHAKKVQLYKDETVSLFRKFEVEKQIEDIQNLTARLPSGGSLVINVTEALVAIDINSGKSTRERHIEETAFNTNLEAATEIARQLRLKDLGGLVVVDFIDMENSSHIQAVERRLRESLKQDRARIQVGRISQFGLLELSRQRLRPSILESLTQPCQACSGTGYIRSVESTALALLRSLEDVGIQGKVSDVEVAVSAALVLYLFNNKRSSIESIERKFNLKIRLVQDITLTEEAFVLKNSPSKIPPSNAKESSKNKSKNTPLEPSESRSTDDPEAPSKETSKKKEFKSSETLSNHADSLEKTSGNRRRKRRKKKGNPNDKESVVMTTEDLASKDSSKSLGNTKEDSEPELESGTDQKQRQGQRQRQGAESPAVAQGSNHGKDPKSHDPSGTKKPRRRRRRSSSVSTKEKPSSSAQKDTDAKTVSQNSPVKSLKQEASVPLPALSSVANDQSTPPEQNAGKKRQGWWKKLLN